MSITGIFFGDKNIKLLTRVLAEELDIEDTKSAREACRKLLVSQMQLVFKKNEDKIIKADPKKILPKLNEKSVNEVIKIHSMHAHANRNASNRQDSRQDNRKKKPTGPRAMYSNMDDTGFAPLDSSEGTFYTATGEVGKSMFFGNIGQQNQQMFGNNKASNREELDRQVMMRRAEYEADDGGYDNGMGQFGDQMMGMNMGYKPNNRQRPAEINFCIDGGDTRGIANGAVNDNDGFFNPGMMGMNGMNQMNPGMMNQNPMMNQMQMNQMNLGMMNQHGMNQPQMMQMGQMNPNMMNNQMGGRGNNADIDAKLAQIEAERSGNFNMFNQNQFGQNQYNQYQNQYQNQNYNQMSNMNPFNNLMSDQYNQNFHMGGRGGNSELEERLKDKKREIANKLGLDPNLLMTLKPDQIESLLNDNSSDSNNSSNDSDNSSDDSNPKSSLSVKELLLKKLVNKKKANEQTHKKLGKDVKGVLDNMKSEKTKKSKNTKNTKIETFSSDSSSDSSSESSESEPETRIKSKSKARSKTKSVKFSESDSSDSDNEPKSIKSKRDVFSNTKSRKTKSDTESESDTDHKSNIKVKKRDETDKKQTITIKSEDLTEPQFYNNYRMVLDKPIKNITKILLSGESDFPLLKPVVDEKHNTFCIIYDDESLPIVLEPKNDYTISAIINETNEALEDEDIPIRLKLDKKNTVTVESSNSDKFSLDLKSNSIGSYLGFQKDTYSGKTKYTSETPHMFLDQRYFMFIKEISNEAVCEITPEGKVKQLIKNIPNLNIKSLTIQYFSNSNKTTPVEFYDEPHEISFDFYSSTDDNGNRNSESRR